MHCSDLERHLEACLDGQLGDSRRQALKDHLAICGSCRERVDSLRRFEAELQRRLRSMQHEVSLWQPLGLETAVAPAPPPAAAPVVLRSIALVEPGRADGAAPGRGHRLLLERAAGTPAATSHVRARRLQNLAGVALLVAAVGAVVDLTLVGLGWLAGDRQTSVYRAYVEGAVELDLRTAEAGRLAVWLGEQLGTPVSLPQAPRGFALVGGALAPEGLPETSALAVYSTAGGPALLLIEAASPRDADAPIAPKAQLEDGLARLEWQDGGHAYSLIGALPPEKLSLFAD